MRVSTLVFGLSCVSTAIGCGGDGGPRPPQAASGYRLAPAGDAQLVVHPGEVATVAVVLAQADVGAVPNARIHFEMSGDSSGAALDAHDAFTGPDGVARVGLRAGDPGTIDVVATAFGLDAAESTLNVEVVPVRKLLRAVAVLGTTPDPDGQTASVSVSAPGSVALRVREIDADTGSPITGDTVVFALPDGVRASLGRSGEKTARATTNDSGEAQAFLVAADAEDAFEASAYCTTGGAPVYFAVTVVDARPVPDPPPCDSSDPACSSGCDPGCDPGTHCDPDGLRCVPDPDGLPDVTGVWYTKHVFGIRESIPLVVRDIFTSIRVLDQLLSGKLGLPSWLQPVMDTVLRQFLPGWFYTVVRLGDDLVTVLSYLRAEGKMRLAPGVDAMHVKGTEVWTTLVFYWLPLCGDDIDGIPDVPPQCARFDVQTGDADFPSTPTCQGRVLPTVTPKPQPFTAAIDAVPGSSSKFQLTVPQRSVELDMRRAVVTAIDAALSVATPWSCIEDATDCRNGRECLVDCAGVGQWVSAFTKGFFAADIIENACAGAVGLAGRTAADLLASIQFKTDTLAFAGRATIREVGSDDWSCRSGINCAGQLGNDRFDSDLRHHTDERDGAWVGSFFDDGAAAMPGAWEATRDQFQ